MKSLAESVVLTGSYEYRPVVERELFGHDSHTKTLSTWRFELWFQTTSGMWLSADLLGKWGIRWEDQTSASQFLSFFPEKEE